MNTTHKIINGDSRQMSELADRSVHLIITSPPYWQLKDYGMDRLNNDLTVRLTGIKQNPQNNEQAIEYLREKLHGKRVFLKYDEQKHDSDNNLLVYLYLENKTFINAHLLKNKLVDVDNSLDFTYRKKFLSYEI